MSLARGARIQIIQRRVAIWEDITLIQASQSPEIRLAHLLRKPAR